LHGTNRKFDRKKTMDDFRNGKVDNLIASDLAARGLQIDGITHIFNMTMSENAQDYLHRAGRTGRNGNDGTVVSIVTAYEYELLKGHAKKLGLEITLL
ncbi:MAG: C-terminal helicase domain-containing protein, partial [Clostridia bacterium]